MNTQAENETGSGDAPGETKQAGEQTRLVKISSLIGKPVAGVTADIRSRKADGSLIYPDDENHKRGPIMVKLKAVAVEQSGFCCGSISKRPGEQGKFPWLYWYWDGYSCGYAGQRIDGGKMPNIYIELGIVE